MTTSFYMPVGIWLLAFSLEEAFTLTVYGF